MLVIWGDADDPALSEFALPVTTVNECSHSFGRAAEQVTAFSPESVHHMDGCHRYQRARCAVRRSAFLKPRQAAEDLSPNGHRDSFPVRVPPAALLGPRHSRMPFVDCARGARSVSFPPNQLTDPTTSIMRARVVGSREP